MQTILDDDVRKRLLEKSGFELAAKGVLRLGIKIRDVTASGGAFQVFRMAPYIHSMASHQV